MSLCVTQFNYGKRFQRIQSQDIVFPNNSIVPRLTKSSKFVTEELKNEETSSHRSRDGESLQRTGKWHIRGDDGEDIWHIKRHVVQLEIVVHRWASVS